MDPNYDDNNPETKILPDVTIEDDYIDDVKDTYREDIEKYNPHGPSIPYEDDGSIPFSFYQGLYDAYLMSIDDVAELARNAEENYQQSEILSSKLSHANTELNQLKVYSSSKTSKNEAEREELNQQKDQLEQDKSKFKATKIGLVAACIGLVIGLIVVSFLYMGAKNDGDLSSSQGAALEEQVRSLKTSLDGVREEKASLQKENSELAKSNESESKKSDKERQRADRAEQSLEDKDQQIRDLEEQNQQLENQEPETVTKTVVQEQPGEAQTITSTVTSVVENPLANNNEDED